MTVRRYPTVQKRLLDTYILQLAKIGFIKPFAQASWQASPHLAHKDAKSVFHTIIDLQPMNAATNAKKFPILVLKVEPSYFKYSRHFASAHFVLDSSKAYRDLNSTMHLGLLHQ